MPPKGPQRRHQKWPRSIQKLWLNFDRQSLTRKLLFTTSIGFILIISLGTYAFENMRRDAIAKIAVTEALYEAQLIKVNLMELMQLPQNRESGVEFFLSRLTADKDINKVNIFDAEGTIVFSTEEGALGKKVAAQAERSSWVTPDRGMVSFSEDQSRKALRILYPIMGGDRWSGGVEFIVALDRVYQEFALNRLWVVGVAVLAILIGGILIRWVVHRIVRRPIKKLMAVMDQARRGELGVRIRVHEDPDLRRLSLRFNAMVRGIERSQKRIEEQFQNELAQANRLASLGQYISKISHEVKNPLAAISGALHTIKDEIQIEDGSQVFDEIELKIKHIEQTVTNLLRYARQAPPLRERCRVKTPIQNALQLARHQLDNHQIEVNFEKAAGFRYLWADEGQLQQLFLNLILNAVQAMPLGGVLTIRRSEKILHRKEGKVEGICVEVEDNGNGIDPKHLSEIFKPFFSQRHGGTGMGLSVVQGIVEAHDGQIEVTSKLYQGTCFSVFLPYYQAPAGAPAAAALA